MSGKTGIGWTESTWNCITGCDRLSDGCLHCYAQTLAARLKAAGNPRYQRDGNPRTSGPGFGLTLHPDKLTDPLHWKSPRMVFVNSMSDLFHDEVPDSFIADIFAVMALAPQHTFQILTKRPRRMCSLLNDPRFGLSVIQEFLELVPEMGQTMFSERWPGWPLPNVWLGTSVEDQRWADQRIPLLLQAPASVHFVSAEPLLGRIDLRPWLPRPWSAIEWAESGEPNPEDYPPMLGWTILGGESGSGHRPMDMPSALALVEQCQQAGVATYVKQDSGPRPGMQGRFSDDVWALKEFPKTRALA